MFFLFFVFWLFHPPFIHALTSTSSTQVDAFIDVNRVTIYGYTSPQSKVELTSIGVSNSVTSDSTGYFKFDQIIIPKNYSELCLDSLDNNYRQTTPICLPLPPKTNYNTNIGPILLPPTLTLEQDQIKPNSTVVASGQAIPNSTVDLHFYQTDDHAPVFTPTALAYSLPAFSATTDSEGNFSLNLPTAYSSSYRLYASTEFQDNFSPKSNTLIYNLPSLWYLFLLQHRYLLILLPLFILSLITLFLFLFINKKSKIKSHFYPSLYPEYLPRTLYIPE